MGLAGQGLRIVPRKLQNFLPLNERDYLAVGAGRTKSEVAKYSARDAERLDDFTSQLTTLADVVRETLLLTPPKFADAGWRDSLR